jgi:hypothetical protein
VGTYKGRVFFYYYSYPLPGFSAEDDLTARYLSASSFQPPAIRMHIEDHTTNNVVTSPHVNDDEKRFRAILKVQ